MARTTSDAGKKKAAARRYIDAQAKSQKAMVSFHAALDRYNETTAGEESARSECEACGVPVGPKPVRLTVLGDECEEKPEVQP